MIRRLFALMLIAGTSLVAQPALAADSYVFDNNHTEVQFQWTHFGFSTTSAQFRDVSGTLMFDENDVTKSSIDVTLNVQSLWTGREYFTAHLLSADFFNWLEYKTASFESTEVTKASGSDHFKVTGDLTIHGITKQTTFDVRINKVAQSPVSKAKTVGFEANTTVSRKAYGMGKYVPAVSDDVKITIRSEMNRKADVQ